MKRRRGFLLDSGVKDDIAHAGTRNAQQRSFVTFGFTVASLQAHLARDLIEALPAVHAKSLKEFRADQRGPVPLFVRLASASLFVKLVDEPIKSSFILIGETTSFAISPAVLEMRGQGEGREKPFHPMLGKSERGVRFRELPLCGHESRLCLSDGLLQRLGHRLPGPTHAFGKPLRGLMETHRSSRRIGTGTLELATESLPVQIVVALAEQRGDAEDFLLPRFRVALSHTLLFLSIVRPRDS